VDWFGVVLFGMLGLGITASGAAWARGRRGLRRGRGKWLADLRSWGVAEAEAAGLAMQLDAQSRRLGGGASVVFGVVYALVALTGAAQLSGLAALPFLPAPLDDRSMFGLFVLAALLGTGIGYPVAFWRVRRAAAGGPRYADLRPRRLADYRTPWLGWATAGLVAVEVAVTLWLVLAGGYWAALPTTAGALLAVVVVFELMMALTAGAARTVTAADPALARRGDDLFRSTVVQRIQVLECLVLACVCALQSIAFPQVAEPAAAIDVVVSLIGALVFVCLMLFVGFQEDGRLGGRVSGWAARSTPD
jgi:hypothetical protein